MPSHRSATVLKLSKSERTELQHQAEAHDGRADSARHARLILLLAEGFTWAEIRARLHCSDSYIARWSKRFREERLAGLYARYAGRERYKVTDRLESRVLNRTRQRRPSDGSRHWSSRKLAAELGGAVSHTTVARIWSRHGITPHGLRHQATSDAPAFVRRPVDIIGVYLHRPQHAAIFRVDESAAPEESDQQPGVRQRDVPTREGVRALYAALKSGGGTFEAEPARRQTSAEFAAFLAAIAAEQPADREIRVIADNPSARKTRAITTLMTDHPNLRMHFMANHAAWLNQVEEGLMEIERGAGTVDDGRPEAHLEHRLIRYLRRRSQRDRSMKWIHLETRKADDRPGGGAPV